MGGNLPCQSRISACILVRIMLINDGTITNQILKVADQYNNNISTRFLRPYFTAILAEGDLAREISDLTEQTDSVVSQGVHIDELYGQILAMARFIYLVRTSVLPNIRNMAGSSGNDANKIYRDMAVNNFGANISVLADLVNELYMMVVEFDKRMSPKGRTVASEMAGLSEIGRYLVTK